jgi:hypothetical protein
VCLLQMRRDVYVGRVRHVKSEGTCRNLSSQIMSRNMQMFSILVLDGSAKEQEVLVRTYDSEFDSSAHVYIVRPAGNIKF